jgi:diguanylate cyclase (GGDEF)-like protein/PAS domain S-box-containing protein
LRAGALKGPLGRSDASFVSPAPATTTSLRAVLQRAIPALIGFALIIALGGVALQTGKSNLEAAERTRLEGRAATLLSTAQVSNQLSDPEGDTRTAASSPFTPDNAAVNEGLLAQYRTNGAIASLAMLVAADGTTLAASPAGDAIDVKVLGEPWARAVAGEPGYSDVIRHHDEVAYAGLLPIGGSQPWGVLVLVRPSATAPMQKLFEETGALNSRPGGFLLTDRHGVALEAWSRDLLGTHVLPPADAASLTPGATRLWTTGSGEEEITYIGTALGHDYTMIFTQRSSDLFGDLRSEQHQRDATLLAVLGAALAILTLFQLWREISARRTESRLQALLANSHDLVLVAGPDGDLVFVSQAIEGLLGKQADAWWHRSLADLCHPDDQDQVARLLANPASGPLLNVRMADTRLRAGRDAYRFFDIDARDVRDHPEVGGVLLTCHEAGQRKDLQDELSHQATHDRLTGLSNRARLGERLEGLIANGHPVRPFALLFLDLDRFKPVNDTMGHEAGDEVLVTIAERLRVAAGESEAFRLGGDEFGVLLEGAAEAAAVATATALLDAVQLPVTAHAGVANLGASIGIALAEPTLPLHSGEELLRRADQAMYDVKRRGRGRWMIAAPEATGTARGTVTLPTMTVATPAPVGAAPDPPGAATSTAIGSDPHRRRLRLRALAPTAVAATLVLGIAGVGHQQTRDGQRLAEADVRHYVTEFLVRNAVAWKDTGSVEQVDTTTNSAPWTLDGGPVDAAVVKAFATSPQTGDGGRAVLATPAGTPLTAYPEGTPLALDPAGADWRTAAAGTPTIAWNVGDPDDLYGYYLVPVRRDGQVAGVLALGISERRGVAQVSLARSGWAGYQGGGWSLMGADGVITTSWNPDLAGAPMADPARIRPLQPGETQDLSTEDQVLEITPVELGGPPLYLIFSIPTAEYYKDLRIGQLQRDLSLLVVAAGAIAGLILVNGRRERALRRSEARIAALLAHSNDIIVVLDDQNRATFVSSAAERLLGYRLSTGDLDLVSADDAARMLALAEETRRNGAASLTDVRLLDRDGGEHVFDLEATDLRDHRDVRGLLVTCHEVTERRALQDQLARQARRDPLTGLPNRAELESLLADLDGPEPYAVLFADLDGFKAVNDTLGHDAGDRVLQVVADRFVAGVRGAGERGRDEVCRLGGDELAIILRGATEDVARSTADRLIAAAREPIQLDGEVVISIGASIGIAVGAGDRNADTVLRLADRAMYQAKQAGRGRYAVFGNEGGDGDQTVMPPVVVS